MNNNIKIYLSFIILLLIINHFIKIFNNKKIKNDKVKNHKVKKDKKKNKK